MKDPSAVELNNALFSRPRTLKDLAITVNRICKNVDHNVSCTRPPQSIRHTMGKVEVYSLTPYQATQLTTFLSHCRKVFTENTIRAMFAFFGGANGSMGRPINARGSIPYYNLSVRVDAPNSQGGQVGSGAQGGDAPEVPITSGPVHGLSCV